MSKRHKRLRKQQRVASREHYNLNYGVVLDLELKQLKEDIELATADFDEGSLNDLWSQYVLEFCDKFIDPDLTAPLIVMEGPAKLFISKWNDFLDRFWKALLSVQNEDARRKYLVAYVNRKAAAAWRVANDTDNDLPGYYQIIEGTSPHLYDQFAGDLRLPHIWRDQLVWACEFLKIPMF